MTIISKIKSNLKRLKILDILMLVVFVLILLKLFLPGVPVDSQPRDVKSARQLAKSIARAGCGIHSLQDFNFEKDYAVFTCKQWNGDEMMFDIYTFYNQTAKNKVVNDLMSREEWSLFKTGPYYLVSAGKPEYATSITAEDFSGFPGELSR